MRVEVLVVGDEVLSGAIPDTNSGLVARRLFEIGLELARVTVVGDGAGDILSAAHEALGRAQVLITSGGLGPTPDDRTKEALAELCGDPLVLDTATLEEIRARFARRGLEMPESNRKQALLPSRARKIPNPLGSAPGVHWVRDAAEIFLLPGVQSEFVAMLDASVLPRLRELAPGEPVASAEFRTVGLPESVLVERLRPVLEGGAALEWGFYAGPQGVDVRLRAPGARHHLFDAACAEVRTRLGHHIYTEEPGVPLEEIVRRLLTRRGQHLVVAESCTGGLLGAMLTAVPGASVCFFGGFVTYADAAKRDWLGVPEELLHAHGAVSAPVASAMARRARERAGVELGLAVTGIAGPTGGTLEKPVGLVFLALSAPDGSWTRRLQLGTDRALNRVFACQRALDMLRLYELGLPCGEPA